MSDSGAARHISETHTKKELSDAVGVSIGESDNVIVNENVTANDNVIVNDNITTNDNVIVNDNITTNDSVIVNDNVTVGKNYVDKNNIVENTADESSEYRRRRTSVSASEGSEKDEVEYRERKKKRKRNREERRASGDFESELSVGLSRKKKKKHRRHSNSRDLDDEFDDSRKKKKKKRRSNSRDSSKASSSEESVSRRKKVHIAESDDDSDALEDDDFIVDDTWSSGKKLNDKQLKKLKKRMEREKRRRKEVSRYLDVEAGVDDDELDYDDTEEAQEARKLAVQQELQRKREQADGSKGVHGMELLEKTIQDLESRAEKNELMVENDVIIDDDMDDEIDNDQYLAEKDTLNAETFALSIKPGDPKLWAVKVQAPGEETSVCVSVLRKCISWAQEGRVLPVFSCTYSPNTRGYVFVEAMCQEDVKFGLEDVKVHLSAEIKILSYKHLADLFTVSKSDEDSVEIGHFLRVKRGVNAGDLGEILDYDMNEKKVIYAVVPRLDIAAIIAKAGGNTIDNSGNSRNNIYNQHNEHNRDNLYNENNDHNRDNLQTAHNRDNLHTSHNRDNIMNKNTGHKFSKNNRPPQKLLDRNEIDRLGGQIQRAHNNEYIRFGGFNFDKLGRKICQSKIDGVRLGSSASLDVDELQLLLGTESIQETEDLIPASLKRQWKQCMRNRKKKGLDFTAQGLDFTTQGGDTHGVDSQGADSQGVDAQGQNAPNRFSLFEKVYCVRGELATLTGQIIKFFKNNQVEISLSGFNIYQQDIDNSGMELSNTTSNTNNLNNLNKDNLHNKDNHTHKKGTRIILSVDDIKQYICTGCSIGVTKGQWKGRRGVVSNVNFKDDTATVFLPSISKEVTLPTASLVENELGNDKVGAAVEYNGYKVGSLLQLSSGKIGLLLALDTTAGTGQFLAVNGESFRDSLAFITAERKSLRQQAIDSTGTPFGIRADVRILDGAHAGRVGKVAHIYGGDCFIKVQHAPHDSANAKYLAAANLATDFNNSKAYNSSSFSSLSLTVPLGSFVHADQFVVRPGADVAVCGVPGMVGMSAEGVMGDAMAATSRNVNALAMNLNKSKASRTKRVNPLVGRVVEILDNQYRGMFATIRDVTPTVFFVLLQVGREVKVSKKEVRLIECDEDTRVACSFETPVDVLNLPGKLPTTNNYNNNNPAETQSKLDVPIWCVENQRVKIINEGDYFGKEGIIRKVIPYEDEAIVCQVDLNNEDTIIIVVDSLSPL